MIINQVADVDVLHIRFAESNKRVNIGECFSDMLLSCRRGTKMSLLKDKESKNKMKFNYEINSKYLSNKYHLLQKYY